MWTSSAKALTGPVPKINISCAFVLIASSLFFAQQPASTPTRAPQNSPAQPQSSQPTTPQEKACGTARHGYTAGKECGRRVGEASRHPEAPKGLCLEYARDGRPGRQDRQSSQPRCTCPRPHPEEVRAPSRWRKKALKDDKPEVRSAAATALGDMQARSSIPKLKDALADDEPAVVLSAAHALDLMHDRSAFEVYYAVLTGQRKTSKGLIASQIAVLKDPKKLALMGFEEGIGFVPFAGIGWEAYRRLAKTDPSPVRAAAATVLARDPDSDSGNAIGDAATDDKNLAGSLHGARSLGKAWKRRPVVTSSPQNWQCPTTRKR